MNKAPSSAVILGAGLGSRFGQRGLLRPKGFIEFGGQPIIEMSILKMRDAGIGRVLIVTGHLADFYQELAGRYPELVELVHNPRYAESGSMYSLYCAREQINDDFWLFESDLVYERKALDELMSISKGTALLMSGPTGSKDEVYIEAADGLLRNMSKQREKLASVAGELVGICRVSMDCYAQMNVYAEEIFEQTLRLEYEQALVAAAKILPVECHLLDDLAWSEIDTEEHWQRVNEQVYPAIVSRDRLRQEVMR